MQDVSFQYLKMFFEPDDAKLESIRVKYSSGAYAESATLCAGLES